MLNRDVAGRDLVIHAVLRVAFLVAILVAPLPARASVLYVLQDQSLFQEGCFPPCLCPVMETAPLVGTFELGLITVGDVFDFYAVDDVRWFVPGASFDRRIDGRGTYKVSRIVGQNEMSLDLSINQGAIEHYTSDTVPVGAPFPEIGVTVSKSGMICRDTALTVQAKPTPRLAVERGALVWDSGLEETGYDVVRGSLAILRATHGDFSRAIDGCLADDLHDHTLPLPNTPSNVDASFLLVRAGSSTYDTGAAAQVRSRDPGIAASPAACP